MTAGIAFPVSTAGVPRMEGKERDEEENSRGVVPKMSSSHFQRDRKYIKYAIYMGGLYP